MTSSLTTDAYWNRFYAGQEGVTPVDVTSWKTLADQDIYALKRRYGADRGRVLELGGGASPWLAYLAPRFPAASYVCLDFAAAGVARLRAWRARQGVNNLEIVQGDFFTAYDAVQPCDLVFSHGVVEHFADLPSVLQAHARYLARDGRMLTVIPNMAGCIGWLTRVMNRPVYDVHVPHDLRSLTDGHKQAGLRIIENGYLCSNHFGVLSSCVTRRHGLVWQVYKTLSRVSKAVWFVESRLGRLPTSRIFSPYIYVVAARGGGWSNEEGP